MAIHLETVFKHNKRIQGEVDDVQWEVMLNIIDKETASMEVVRTALLNVKGVGMGCTN